MLLDEAIRGRVKCTDHLGVASGRCACQLCDLGQLLPFPSREVRQSGFHPNSREWLPLTLGGAGGLNEIMYEKLPDGAWEMGKFSPNVGTLASSLSHVLSKFSYPLSVEGRDEAERLAHRQHPISIWRPMSPLTG